jgi:hypothetical protein
LVLAGAIAATIVASCGDSNGANSPPGLCYAQSSCTNTAMANGVSCSDCLGGVQGKAWTGYGTGECITSTSKCP